MSGARVRPKDVVIEHGGSFDGVKIKAHFYLPLEADFHAVRAGLLAIGSDCRGVRPEGTWMLCRFVGERKNYKTVHVVCRTVPHNVHPCIRLEIHPDGTIEMYEKGRKLGFSTTVGTIYTRAMLNAALQKSAEKARSKKAKRKLQRQRR